MSTLLLAPHNDDETLFAAYTILRHKPTVIICFRGDVQATRGGPSAGIRSGETNDALEMLGVEDHGFIPISDINPDETLFTDLLAEIGEMEWETVFAPAEELGGHEQHNMVARAAKEVFGDRVVSYLTYMRGCRRSRSDNEVVPEPHWPALKFKAMACYASQINLPDCQPWFAADDCLREWYA